MKIEFTKMQGAGNDYVYVDLRGKEIPFSPEKLARAVSPRGFSVGSDGLVLILDGDSADARMRMFNADGSEGMMCGNALRCVAKYLYTRDRPKKSEFTVETMSGIKRASVNGDGTVSAYVGRASFRGKVYVNESGFEAEFIRADVGNPHAVCFTNGADGLDLTLLGPKLENHMAFGQRVNLEFAERRGDGFFVRVWERGSGETLSCGTGACAVAAAAVKSGLAEPLRETEICLRGGKLTVACGPEFELTLTGDAETVYDGVYQYVED